MAVPHINNVESNIIKIFRDPILNIKSFVDLEFFSKRYKNGKYLKYMKDYIKNIDVLNKSEIVNAAIYYIEWNKLFDDLIGNKYYEIICFDQLIREKEVIIFNKKIKTIDVIVNDKKNKKKKNIHYDEIINILKENKLYDDLYEQYNKMLKSEYRKV